MELHLAKLFRQKSHLPFSSSDLLRHFGLSPDDQAALQRCLRNLEGRGDIVRIHGGRYLACQSPSLVSGRIQLTKAGRGFVTPDDPALPEIPIPARETGTALHDDHVLVYREAQPRAFWPSRLKDAPAAGGCVIRVLERRRTRFVGTLRRTGGRWQVLPDDPRFARGVGIEVPGPRLPAREAKPGEKVVVELLRWTSRHVAPEGRILEVLGASSSPGVDMLSVLRQYDLSPEFPARVLREARRFGRHVVPSDLQGRRDCRDHRIITIDPDDARDFDDAICVEPAGANRWKLWVHIADVSHYVRPGSALDEEARRRGNSSYLVDRVIPMLPEELSQELCSLKPRVDRLTKCVEFLLSGDGKVLRTDFYPAVIHSQKRFTYAEAMATLNRDPGKDDLAVMLHQASQLAQAVRQRRFEAGSLDLDFPETKIRLDAQGRVARIERQENDHSHQLVEEFMLLANEAVAGHLMKRKRPALYRVHEAPDPDRLDEYRKDVLGHAIPCGNLNHPGEVRKLFRHLADRAVGTALKIGFLRSLNRARYTAAPLGHYGLAKKKYTHFTSPIRRYADLLVHRSLFGGDSAADEPPESLHRVADHLSASERNSADAERDSKEIKLHSFLAEQIQSGRPVRYAAQVTGFRDFGLFVDVAELGLGGVVPLSLLTDDHYRHEPDAKLVRGQRTGKVFQIGDVIAVQAAQVDAARKMVDFRIAASPRPAANPRRRTPRPSGPRPRACVAG